MIGIPITIRNHDTGREVVLNDHTTDKENVIALQSFPSMETEVRADHTAKQGAHGEFKLPTYYSGMSIVLQGVIVGIDQSRVWEMKKQLDDVFRLPGSGYSKETQSEKILPAFLTNHSTNPNGIMATDDWVGTDSSIAASADGLEVTADSADDAVVTHEIALIQPIGSNTHVGLDITNRADTGRDFELSVNILDGMAGVIETDQDAATLASGETKRLFVKIDDISALGASVEITVTRLDTGDADTGDVFHVKRVVCVQDPTSTFNVETQHFDGASDPVSRVTYEWTGDPELSTSQAFRMSYPSMFKNTVRLSFVDPTGKEVFVDATPIKVVSYDRPIQQTFLLNFQVILRANFPYPIIEAGAPEVIIGGLGSMSTGLKLPFQIPFSFSEDYITGLTSITVDQPSLAVVRMYGSDDGVLVNPKITNLTNDGFCQILRPLSGSNNYFTIDGLYLTMRDQSGQTVMPYSEGGFIYLEAGENLLLYTADDIVAN